MTPLYRRTFDAEALRREHAPRLRHPHKRAVWERLDGEWAGTVTVTRWGPVALPAEVGPPTEIEVARGHFDYAGPSDGVWHVNFADPNLFFAYGSGLLAQDELQVLEHPALALVREALVAEGLEARTQVGDDGTPVLVAGVERRGALDTRPDVTRPGGLYGNAFSQAPLREVFDALTVLRPPTITNLIAMAAPGYGRGAYSRDEVVAILLTAVTAFSAARAEGAVEVRSGFWGCGAFGGNRTMMITLQVLAARIAGVRLRLYAFNRDGMADANEGIATLGRVVRDDMAGTVDEIVALGLRWGVSDGN